MSEQLAKRYTQVIQYFDGGKKVAEFAQSPDETEARLVWIDEEIGKPLPRERREPRAGGAMSEQERRKVIFCTIWACENEADGPCVACGRVLCFVHAIPDRKQYYCHQCYNKLIDKLVSRYRE